MNIEKKTCSVCLQSKGTTLFCQTDCHHEFCKECLDKWFDAKKRSCPLCRKNIDYFTYQGLKHRVVCIIQTPNNLPPVNINVPSLS